MPFADKKSYIVNPGADTGTYSIVTANGVALAANSQRVAWGMTNLTTGGYLAYTFDRTGSAIQYADVLAPATVMNKGDGGKVVDDSWRGPIWVSGIAAVAVGSANVTRFSVWETYHT